MNLKLARLLLIAALMFSGRGAFAQTHNLAAESTASGEVDSVSESYVTLNVGVELGGLEAAAEEAVQGLSLIGESLSNLASHPAFTPQQRERILQTLSRLDDLSMNLSAGMAQLPETIRKGMLPVTKAGGELSNQIKQIVIISAIALILILLAALLAAYYFVLAPGTRSIIETTQMLNKLAETLESTAQIVEISSQQNLQVLGALRSEADHPL